MTGNAATGGNVAALEITSRSGNVVVHARPVAKPVVVHGTAEIDPDGTVRSRSDNVEIACPEGTDVIIGARSGRVECHGALGRVAVTAHSGRVSIDEAREVEVRTSSGRVDIGRCAGSCRVGARSGSVTIESADAVDVTVSSGSVDIRATRGALVHGGSGNVDIGVAAPGAVEVRAQSGSVTITVAPGVAPVLELESRSGLVHSEVEVGTDGRIAVKTSSGSIRIIRA